jgi:hypothetical protein
MEVELGSLPPTKPQRKNRFGGLRKLFQRKKRNGNDDGNRRRGNNNKKKDFSELKETVEDRTEGNISFSDTGHSPSVNDSFDSVPLFGSSPGRNSYRYGSFLERSDQSFCEEQFSDNDPVPGFQNDLCDSFYQFDVDNNRKGGNSCLIYHSLATNRVQETKESRVYDDEGTEVILFETGSTLGKIQDDVLPEQDDDEIFLSFYADTSGLDEPSIKSSSRLMWNENTNFQFRSRGSNVASSKSSSDTLTWVSHDEDFTAVDARPVREIAFSLETSNSLGGSLVGDSDLESVRKDIITSIPKPNVDLPVFDVDDDYDDDEEDDLLMNLKSPDLLLPSRCANLADGTPKLSPTNLSRAQTDPPNNHNYSNNSWQSFLDITPPTTPLVRNAQSTPPKRSPSSAFLKRKSAFTGKDLLAAEAESFAKFLEESQVKKHEFSPYPMQKSPLTPRNSQLETISQNVDDTNGTSVIPRQLPSTPPMDRSFHRVSSPLLNSHLQEERNRMLDVRKLLDCAEEDMDSFTSSYSRSDMTSRVSTTKYSPSSKTSWSKHSSYEDTTLNTLSAYRNDENAHFCTLFGGRSIIDDTNSLQSGFSSSSGRSSRSLSMRPDLLQEVRSGLEELVREGSSVMMKLLS